MTDQDKEIEEAFDSFVCSRDWALPNGEIQPPNFQTYYEGYRAGQQALLDKASAGFKEMWKKTVVDPDNEDVTKGFHRLTWRAARLSLIKELGEPRTQACPHCGTTELLCGHPKQCTSGAFDG